jgi:peptidoglycan-associated lipoprotein
MKNFFVVATVMLALSLSGCAKKQVAGPTEMQQPTATEQQIKKAPEKITEEKVAKVETKEIPSKVEEISGMFEDIHFDFDKYDIREDARPVLKKVSDYLIKNTTQGILIEGHCDERGTSEYNLGLGDRRAKATRDYLVSLGVPSSRIEMISYGKEKPLCNEHTEECWAKNRMSHFIIMKGKM